MKVYRVFPGSSNNFVKSSNISLARANIISDARNRLVNTNYISHNVVYLLLDTLFMYYTILVEINLELIRRILNNYIANTQSSKIQKYILDSEEPDINKTFIFFILTNTQYSNFKLHIQPKLDILNKVLCKQSILIPPEIKSIISRNNKLNLIFHINYLTTICYLCKFFTMTSKLLIITHEKRYLGFFYHYKIIY